MAETALPPPPSLNVPGATSRKKFLVGGLLILTAMLYLIANGTLKNAQYFLTVDELLAKGDSVIDQNVRMSGVVLGESIEYDAETLTLSFIVADVPDTIAQAEEEGGLADVLREAAANSGSAQTILVIVENQPKPDLLQHEAQAIVEGSLGTDGTFYANNLLLKCPTRYEEAVPEQIAES